MLSSRRQMQLWRKVLYCVIGIIIVLEIIFVFTLKKNGHSNNQENTISQSKESNNVLHQSKQNVIINTDKSDLCNYKEYNQTHIINGYIVTLKYGLYSERTKNGYCVFEVEKEDGKIEEPIYYNRNQIHYFGGEKNQISICMFATGTIKSKAKIQDNKLIIYTDFKVDNIDSNGIKDYNAHQIYLYSDKTADLEKQCAEGAYGFKLEDNIPGIDVTLDDGNVLSLSCLGVSLTTNNKLETINIDILTSSNEKKSILSLESKTDIAGTFSAGYSDENGQKKCIYSNTFKDLYNIKDIKEIYVNDKQVNLNL